MLGFLLRRGVRGAALGAVVLCAAALAQAQVGEAPSLRERLRERLVQRQQGAAGLVSGAPVAAPALAAGDFEQSLNFEGLQRKYLVHVPPSYRPTQPVPLVMALHGGGGSADFMARDALYGLLSKSDQAGFVVVFPNGYSRLPGGKLATWNAGGCCGDARDRNINDVGFVKAVLAAVQGQLNVDARRVYAIGMSNGGMMSHRLACEASDVFRAIASVAGPDATASCAPTHPVSVLHIHARDDDHVLFNGGAGPKAFRDEAKVMNFVSVPETLARWVRREHCAPTPQRTYESRGAYCETYSGCSGGSKVQLCVTEQGGHSWPGAPAVRRGKEAPSTALDANDTIWKFFTALPD